MPLFFHYEEVQFELKEVNKYKNWISDVILDEGLSLDSVSIIFTSNKYLLEINQEYLNHNYFTDVITFNYNIGTKISGDIFVSVDQVKINSIDLGIDFNTELSRVIIHGILHLLGYKDSNEKETLEIRGKEDEALKLLGSI